MHAKRMLIVLPMMFVVLAVLGGQKGGDVVTYKASPKMMEEAASARSPIIGKKAPDFSLPDQNGEAVALSNLKGQWVVLYFYPKDDTPGCTCEATEFTKILADLHGMKAKVYGISDDSAAAHKVFIEKYRLGLSLLSDRDHKVMSNYGAWVTARLGDFEYQRVIRSTMIIGPQGYVRYHWPEVIPEGHAKRVSEKLADLQKQPAMTHEPQSKPQ